MKFCLTLSFIQPDLLCEIAQTAEQYGWDAISVSDHVVNPDQIEARYPYGETGERTYETGDGFLETIGRRHNGRNDGDQPMRVLAVYIGAQGTPNAVAE